MSCAPCQQHNDTNPVSRFFLSVPAVHRRLTHPDRDRTAPGKDRRAIVWRRRRRRWRWWCWMMDLGGASTLGFLRAEGEFGAVEESKLRDTEALSDDSLFDGEDHRSSSSGCGGADGVQDPSNAGGGPERSRGQARRLWRDTYQTAVEQRKVRCAGLNHLLSISIDRRSPSVVLSRPLLVWGVACSSR